MPSRRYCAACATAASRSSKPVAAQLRSGRRRAASDDRDQRPGRLARCHARQRRPRRDLRRRPLGDRRPGLADPDRRPRAARDRRSARPPSPSRAAGLHRVRGLVPENTRSRRPQTHLRPLRPRQRPLRRLPRRADDVLLRLLPAAQRPSLEEAQLAKLDRICEQLRLGPENHLLEIGTGWGGLAIHAAREHGCRVTTTTISRDQHELAQQRVREAGLEDRVDGAAARTTATCAAATTGWSRSR